MRRTATKRLAGKASFQSQHIVFSQSGIAQLSNFTVHLCAAPTYVFEGGIYFFGIPTAIKRLPPYVPVYIAITQLILATEV